MRLTAALCAPGTVIVHSNKLTTGRPVGPLSNLRRKKGEKWRHEHGQRDGRCDEKFSCDRNSPAVLLWGLTANHKSFATFGKSHSWTRRKQWRTKHSDSIAGEIYKILPFVFEDIKRKCVTKEWGWSLSFNVPIIIFLMYLHVTNVIKGKLMDGTKAYTFEFFINAIS